MAGGVGEGGGLQVDGMKGGGMPDLPDTGWGEGEEESYMNGLTGFPFSDKDCFWVNTNMFY